jgi:hypothetical protein
VFKKYRDAGLRSLLSICNNEVELRRVLDGKQDWNRTFSTLNEATFEFVWEDPDVIKSLLAAKKNLDPTKCS